jgi:hypothetical protein
MADKLDMIITQLTRIEGEISTLRAENSTLHGRITDIAVNGCSLAPAHSSLAAQVALNTEDIQKGKGAIFATGVISTIASTVIGWLKG